MTTATARAEPPATPLRAGWSALRDERERGAVWLLGFAPVTYLALSGGGFDIAARSELGIAFWWLVLVGMLAGVLPRARLSPAAWAALGLLGGFLAWTWLAVGWSQSSELTLAEAGRVATYLGVLALGLTTVSRSTVRSLLTGLACAIGLVSTIAVLSRLEPSWFSADSAAHFYATSRLRYPFDYSDGVGEFAALGIPLLLYVATGGRTLVGRALAAGALPAVALCLALTVSRGGMLATAVGLIAFFLLAPDRLPRLATALTALIAVAVEVVALAHRTGVAEAFLGPAPAGQRHSMLLVLVLTCAATAVVQAAITLAVRYGRRPRWLRVSPARARVVAALVGLAVVAGLVVIVASGVDHRLWEQFKRPNPPVGGGHFTRLLSVSGSHRYQYWKVAISAFHAHPWDGIGPGVFQFYWAQHQSLGEYVLNAHSLYIETLAELGIIGLALIGGMLVLVLVDGSIRAFRETPAAALAAATAVAALAGFCAAAGFDWVWQLGVMPMIAMLLAAAVLAGHRAPDPVRSSRHRLITRVVFVVLSLVALWAIVRPLATTDAVRASQAAVRRHDLRAALTDAATAQRLEPGAASPRLQRALVLELLGDDRGASRAIKQAIARERTNWQLWLVASRIEAENGRPAAALHDYRRARALNPRSPIFSQ